MFQPNDNLPNDTDQHRRLKGFIIDNNDPLKLGRVRVKIEGLMEGDHSGKKMENFPWVKKGAGDTSSRPDSGSVNIPEVNSVVDVTFPDGDVNNATYTGHSDDSVDNNQGTMFNEDYPNTYGDCDSTGNFSRTNKTQGYKEQMHSSGFYTQIDAKGTLHVFVPNDVVFHIGGSLIGQIDKLVALVANQDIGIKSKKNMGISGDEHIELLGGASSTFQTKGNIDLNSNVTYGIADATVATVEGTVPEQVDQIKAEKKKMQDAVKEEGKAAKESIKLMAEGLKGTRSE